MRHLLTAGLLAVAALVATPRPADAWINAKFSAGVNWHWQSGNNSLLWGLFHDGQTPGPDFGGGAGFGQPPCQYDFPYFSYNGPPPANVAATHTSHYGAAPAWSGQSFYQPASYSVPYYWYGR